MLNRSSGGQEDGQTDGQVFSGSSGDRHVDFSYRGLVRRSPLSCSPEKKGQNFQINAPVAQSDRAIDFESKGRGFDSLQARQYQSQYQKNLKTRKTEFVTLLSPCKRQSQDLTQSPVEIRLPSRRRESDILTEGFTLSGPSRWFREARAR